MKATVHSHRLDFLRALHISILIIFLSSRLVMVLVLDLLIVRQGLEQQLFLYGLNIHRRRHHHSSLMNNLQLLLPERHLQ
jgi:hypothetical protein